MKTIHQFHSGSAYGDAITNGMLFTQRLLRELGFESEIFVEHLDDRLRDCLRPVSSYSPNQKQMVLVHHSMGHHLVDQILTWPDRKVLYTQG